MPVAQRPPIHRGKQSLKASPGNLRPVKKTEPQTNAKESSDPDDSYNNVSSALRKLVERFRFDQPTPAAERRSIKPDLWWLRDQSHQLRPTDELPDDHRSRPTDLPTYIDISRGRPMMHWKSNRHRSSMNDDSSSDKGTGIGPVSSTGIGSSSSRSVSSTITTTTSTANTKKNVFQPAVPEKPARPLFTRLGAPDDRENDILYQWRLRRRLEQAQSSEPPSTSTKFISRSTIDQMRPNPVPKPSKEIKQQTSPTNNGTSSIASPPIRSMRDASTQTLQDASIQTSPILFSTTTHCSSTEEEHQREPIDRKVVRISFALRSPQKHAHQTIPTITSIDRSIHFQSSYDSTFTNVTSVTNHRQIGHTSENLYNDQNHRQSFGDVDDTDDSDEVLRMLMDRRNELLVTYRDIEERLQLVDGE